MTAARYRWAHERPPGDRRRRARDRRSRAVEVAHGSSRTFAGRVCDAYLVRVDVGQRGYSVVIWRGRHVADPTELSRDEASAYFHEVLRVGRAVEQQYEPIGPGHPPHFMRIDLQNEPKIPDDLYARDLAALRARLDQ